MKKDITLAMSLTWTKLHQNFMIKFLKTTSYKKGAGFHQGLKCSRDSQYSQIKTSRLQMIAALTTMNNI